MSNARSAGRPVPTRRWPPGSSSTASPASRQTSMRSQRSARRSPAQKNASSSKPRDQKMLNKGLSEEELFSFFSQKKREDLDHDYILSSMCTLPHPVAVRAHCMFMETNLGDPGLFPGTASLEQLLDQTVRRPLPLPGCGRICHQRGHRIQYPGAPARKGAEERDRLPECRSCPESAHFSFKKACDILGLEMRGVPLWKDLPDGCRRGRRADRQQHDCASWGLPAPPSTGWSTPSPISRRSQ